MSLARIGTMVRERREVLGLTQSRLAQMSGLSRRTLVRLEGNAPQDLSLNRVGRILAVLGLELGGSACKSRERHRGLWIAAKTASVSCVNELAPNTLGHILASGQVPEAYQAHVAHLLDEAPVPVVVVAVEEAAASEGVPPKTVWRNVAKIARSLAVYRRSLWT